MAGKARAEVQARAGTKTKTKAKVTARSRAPAGAKRPRATSCKATGVSSAGLVLELDGHLYPRAAVDRARAAFAHLARIEVCRVGELLRIEFHEAEPELAGVLPDEFANYALGCMTVNP
ncbi:MAG TPA: HxsD-like protein [Myxococcota bacterium]|nr:HxsD-like protein [Myxococcota bacterium]